jgi:hypothetical protein
LEVERNELAAHVPELIIRQTLELSEFNVVIIY